MIIRSRQHDKSLEVFQTRVDSCLTNHEPFRSARVVDPFSPISRSPTPVVFVRPKLKEMCRSRKVVADLLIPIL